MASDDLVDRLRRLNAMTVGEDRTAREAADEIERLRARLTACYERELQATEPSECPTCHGQGQLERLATPDEVDDGCELGIAYDPCPSCFVATEPSEADT